MAYPTVLPLANAQLHIYNWLLAINNGLYQFNQRSQLAIPLPNEVEFQMIAIDSFQALSVVTNQASTTNDSPPSGQDSQTTTHGETVDTTDADQTELVGYDPTAALDVGDNNSPTLGLQAQPFPQ